MLAPAARGCPAVLGSGRPAKNSPSPPHRASLLSPSSELKQLCWTPQAAQPSRPCAPPAALRWATSHPPRSGHAPHRALLGKPLTLSTAGAITPPRRGDVAQPNEGPRIQHPPNHPAPEWRHVLPDPPAPAHH